MLEQPMRKMPVIRQAIFPIIPEHYVVRSATEPARSVWMYSFCLMWTFLVRSVVVPDIKKKHGRSFTKIKQRRNIRCRS